MTQYPPEKRRPLAGWSFLSRAIPRRTRQRVFTPAYNDLLADRLRNTNSRRQGWVFGMRVCLMVVDTYRVAGVSLVGGWRRRGRRMALLVLIAMVIGVGVVMGVRRSYATSGVYPTSSNP